MQRTKARRPYARYIAGLSVEPRPEHLEWHNTVLPLDHPWWHTHTPPNDWGCKCKKVSVSQREVDRDGLKVLKDPPTNGTYKWKDPRTGKEHTFPNGIGKFWDYNPGRAAWGQEQAERIMTGAKGARYKNLTKGDWASNSLERELIKESTDIERDYDIKPTPEGMRDALRRQLGGEEKQFSFTANDFRYELNVNAKVLADHLGKDRAPFIPFLSQSLEDPQEIWQTFEENIATGKVVLRTRFVKRFDEGKTGKGIAVVMDARAGQMEAWTILPNSRVGDINKIRVGKILFKKRKG